MAQKSALFSVTNGRLEDHIPLTDFSIFEGQGEDREVVGIEKNILLGDQVEIGRGRVKTLVPYKKIPVLPGEFAPRMSKNRLRAYDGTVQKVFSSDEDKTGRLMLTGREAWDGAVYVLVREGLWPNAEGKVIQDLQRHLGTTTKIGRPASFLLDGQDAIEEQDSAEVTEADVSQAAEKISGLNAHGLPVIRGPSVHHAFYRLVDGASILGQTIGRGLYVIENKGGEVSLTFDESLREMFREFLKEAQKKAAASREKKRFTEQEKAPVAHVAKVEAPEAAPVVDAAQAE